MLLSIGFDGIFLRFPPKINPKGIDKMRIRFIIELWGKVGKEGE